MNYEEQAEAFLAKHGIKFRATLSDTKPANWKPAGHHYRVTLSRPANAASLFPEPVDGFPQNTRPNRLTFDFWGSLADQEANVHPSAYDVLACISSDITCPETFEDFCSEFGESEDSIKALQTFRRCSRFAARLKQFFTEQEITELQEIQ